jgi:hypothetical protein
MAVVGVNPFSPLLQKLRNELLEQTSIGRNLEDRMIGICLNVGICGGEAPKRLSIPLARR